MLRALGEGPLGHGPLGEGFGLPELVAFISTSLPQIAPSWGNNAYTLPEDLWAYVFAWGGGASGNVDAVTGGGTYYGGGGGAAGHSKLLLPRGTVLEWNAGIGAHPGFGAGGSGGGVGGDTTVSVDGVLHGTAQGGRAPSVTAAAARSTATGFQINRYGGGSGERGELGQPLIFPGVAYGGGAGGFTDLFGPSMGDVSDTNTHSGGGVPRVAPMGAGGGASTDSSAACYGGRGRVEILLLRPVA